MKIRIWTMVLACSLPLSIYFCVKNLKSSSFQTVSLQDPFEKLLGRETKYWKFIQTKQDWMDLDLYKGIYEKRRHLQYSFTSPFRIPKTIHVIWLGPRPFPVESVENMRTWIAHHPDWDFYFWTDRERMPPCHGMRARLVENFDLQFFEKAYAKAADWGEKADLLLYEILYREGGVYIDHDANCLSFFDPLHRGYDFYAALEMPHHVVNNWALNAGMGVVGSRPYHPLIKQAVQKVLERWAATTEAFKDQDALTREKLNLHRTYIGLTLALKDSNASLGERDIIFPACYFYPNGDLPALYSRHFYAGAWLPDGQTHRQQEVGKNINYIQKKGSKIRKGLHFSLIALIGCLTLHFLIGSKLKKRDQAV